CLYNIYYIYIFIIFIYLLYLYILIFYFFLNSLAWQLIPEDYWAPQASPGQKGPLQLSPQLEVKRLFSFWLTGRFAGHCPFLIGPLPLTLFGSLAIYGVTAPLLLLGTLAFRAGMGHPPPVL